MLEYYHYPPPKPLLKVMERRWANPMVEFGRVRLSNLEYYRKWENNALGDQNDGKGLFCMNKHPYTTESTNKVFSLCMAMSTISDERLNVLAKEGHYDCVVKILWPDEFFKRIQTSLRQLDGITRLLCGPVSYNRGQDVNKNILNSQQLWFHVFQKSPGFSADNEYRLAFIDSAFKHIHDAFDTPIDIEVGNCSDILQIDELP